MKENFTKKLRENTTKSNAKIASNKQKNNKGITLIALIITIIVLLILAGVTINLTLGENGIFKTAEMAGKNYTQAEREELEGLANFENTINNIIGGTESNGESEPDTPVATQLLKDVAQPGDYVKYGTGIEGIGDAGDGILLFRVLYNDETNGLQIISDKSVEQVTLGTDGTNDLAAFQASMDDYNNAINILNEKAEYYATSSSYALDGRCVGSVPTVGIDGKFNAKNTEELGTYSIPDEWTLPSDWSSRDTGCKKWTDYNYTANGVEGVVRDRDAMEVAELWATGEYYWLASRYVDSISSDCLFYVRRVNDNGALVSLNLCHARSDGYADGRSYTFGLRPCISLKSDIKVVGGNGEKAGTAYELGI